MEPMANAHGLVVGIAAYQGIRPLPATVAADARDIHAFMVDPSRGGHRPENSRMLIDSEATGRALRDAMAELAVRADADATVFIYLSGHGARIPAGPDAGEYLLPVDTAAGSQESLARTAISGDEFGRALHALRARRVLVVFDCCHAGGIGTPKDGDVPRPEQGLSERYYETLGTGRGRAILASSREDESSFVMPGAANSLFTRHLLAGLNGGVANDDGLVRVFDLFEYLQPRVTADEPRQHPVFKAHIEENFPVALHLGGRRGSVTTDDDGFRYDAYISYVDSEPDATWVWDDLVPRLTRSGLRVAVSGDVEQPGVARVVGIERGILQSRRTVVVLSPTYLEDGMADFENVLAQTTGIEQGSCRLLPVRIAPLRKLPVRLGMLTTLNLVPGPRSERELQRLLDALHAPLPRHAAGTGF
jgi:hypothetical protein